MKNLPKKATSVVLGLMGALVVGQAMASQPTMPEPKAAQNNYADVHALYAKIHEKVAGSARQDKRGLGFGVNAGRMLTDTMGVEAGYNKLPNQHYDAVKGKDNYSMDVAVKGVKAVQHDVAVFAKAGVARVHHEVNGATNVAAAGHHFAYAPMLALGASRPMNDKATAIVEVSGTTEHHQVPAVIMASVGVGFDF